MPIRRRIRASLLRGLGDVYAVPGDPALGGLDQAIDAAQQCRFARAAEADHRQELAVRDFEADVVEGERPSLVDLGQVFDLQHAPLALPSRSGVHGRSAGQGYLPCPVILMERVRPSRARNRRARQSSEGCRTPSRLPVDAGPAVEVLVADRLVPRSLLGSSSQKRRRPRASSIWVRMSAGNSGPNDNVSLGISGEMVRIFTFWMMSGASVRATGTGVEHRR